MQSSEGTQKLNHPKDTSSLNKFPMPPFGTICTENPVLYHNDHKFFRLKNSEHFIFKYTNMELGGNHLG
jgi:hypothetical protein